MGSFLPYVLLVMLPSIAITGWAAWRVRSTYARWSKVDSGIDLSAFDFARRLLDRQGLTEVKIEPVPGQLTDHYDPRGKVLRVSSAVAGQQQLGSYDSTDRSVGFPQGSGTLSVAAAAVIAAAPSIVIQTRLNHDSAFARPINRSRSRGSGVLDVAISGLAAQPAVGSVIAGATNPEQVQANAAALSWQPTDEDLTELDTIAPTRCSRR